MHIMIKIPLFILAMALVLIIGMNITPGHFQQDNCGHNFGYRINENREENGLTRGCFLYVEKPTFVDKIFLQFAEIDYYK